MFSHSDYVLCPVSQESLDLVSECRIDLAAIVPFFNEDMIAGGTVTTRETPGDGEDNDSQDQENMGEYLNLATFACALFNAHFLSHFRSSRWLTLQNKRPGRVL